LDGGAAALASAIREHDEVGPLITKKLSHGPPGLVILLVAAGFVWFLPWRWTPILGAVAALSQLFGLFAAGQAPRLLAFDPLGGSIGLWIQLLAVTVASTAGIVAAVRDDRARTST
jgi:hypothetical protein